MNLQVIAEHTVDLDIIPENAIIIDLGCRGFGFTKYFNKCSVFPVDVDFLIPEFAGTSLVYDRVAITGHNGTVGIRRTNDPQATSVTEGNDIECETLETYMRENEIDFADLIKIDVEGSEREIILSLTKAPAKQLSIEFHLHTGAYSQPDVVLMVAKLQSLGYKTVQHKLEARHGAGLSYWDSLFVLE